MTTTEQTPSFTPDNSAEPSTNPNRKSRKGLVIGTIGGFAAIGLAGAGIAAANNHAADKETSHSTTYNGEQDDILENGVITVPEETPADNGEVVAESANTLTDVQVQEILSKCPRLTQYYENPIGLLNEIDDGTAQAMYTMLQTSPQGAEEWILMTFRSLEEE